MQKWKVGDDSVVWTADDGEWVEAHVAQRLYDALHQLRMAASPSIRSHVDKALAAADGEDV